MRVRLLNYAGMVEAVEGARLSFGSKNWDNFDEHDLGKIERFMKSIAGKDGGHNKFLEAIQYWLLIDADLVWWKQADTYRVGITKSSESTMHTITKNKVTQSDFSTKIPQVIIDILNEKIEQYKAEKDTEVQAELFDEIVKILPSGYMQTRMVNVNAKTLRNMYKQRKSHKLQDWREFCNFIEVLPYSEYITAE